jgi:hypothetical protein
VIAATEALVAALEPSVASGDWEQRAGALTWSCRHTLAHAVDCVYWYASNLVRRSTVDAGSPDVDDATALPQLVDSLRSGGALLALAVDTADGDARGFHPYGMADASGFAAMGCDEVLVHGHDIARGLGVTRYEPPVDTVERTLRRLFPWAPEDADPWTALLWANGRVALGDRPPERKWLWHCAPLDEWDGEIRRLR